ncbi:MAG: LLM class flavin-dependent oxidoreductase [Candidatus Dormibacteria bacterium]
MEIGFAIDPAQRLSHRDELSCVRYAAELGYHHAWTPGRGDASAFDRCRAWFEASGMATGILVVPASDQPPRFYAELARGMWEASGGRFVLGVGSGRLAHPRRRMPDYIGTLRSMLPSDLPVFVAALGPSMLRVASETGDGVALNWCSAEQLAWSRIEVERAATGAGRPIPKVVGYVRTAVDPLPQRAKQAALQAMLGYANVSPAYRAHFRRMGFAEQLAEGDQGGNSEVIAKVAASGAPGSVRPQFGELSRGLDVSIVRVLVAAEGDANSARRVLEECRPR